MLYVTPNHLNSLSKDVTGRSAGELIRDRILLEAKRLLTNATMSISEIANELSLSVATVSTLLASNPVSKPGNPLPGGREYIPPAGLIANFSVFKVDAESMLRL